jgi:hypothetical protein
LRDGLEFQEVKGVAGLEVAEAGAKGTTGGVEVEGMGAETGDGCAFLQGVVSGVGSEGRSHRADDTL